MLRIFVRYAAVLYEVSSIHKGVHELNIPSRESRQGAIDRISRHVVPHPTLEVANSQEVPEVDIVLVPTHSLPGPTRTNVRILKDCKEQIEIPRRPSDIVVTKDGNIRCHLYHRSHHLYPLMQPLDAKDPDIFEMIQLAACLDEFDIRSRGYEDNVRRTVVHDASQALHELGRMLEGCWNYNSGIGPCVSGLLGNGLRLEHQEGENADNGA